MFNYYKSELDRLKNTEYCKTVILSDGNGNMTKTLNVTLESIPVLIKFLERESKRLKKETRS